MGITDGGYRWSLIFNMKQNVKNTVKSMIKTFSYGLQISAIGPAFHKLHCGKVHINFCHLADTYPERLTGTIGDSALLKNTSAGFSPSQREELNQ